MANFCKTFQNRILSAYRRMQSSQMRASVPFAWPIVQLAQSKSVRAAAYKTMKRPFSRLKQPRYDRERLCWPRNPMSSAIVGGSHPIV